jgi:hypothetical protein
VRLYVYNGDKERVSYTLMVTVCNLVCSHLKVQRKVITLCLRVLCSNIASYR